MSMFFFYNNRKPRRFNYKPILFDQEEEQRQPRLEKRIAEIKKEMGVEASEEPKVHKVDLGEEFIQQTTHLKKRKEREKTGQAPFFTNNMLLFIFLLVLAAVLYFLLFYR